MNRRKFLIDLGLGAAGMFGSKTPVFFGEDWGLDLTKTYRAAAIGSTGHGDFGHGLDKVFVNLPNVEFVAIADENPTGLEAAGKRNGVTRLYTDYRQMLAKDKLDLVSVAMRHSELHEEIVIACAEAGKHVFCEKPIAPDLAAADRMRAACKKNGVKMAVAVQNRVSPAVLQAKQMVKEGRIGELLSMRGNGKEDHRGGGEDLMVLGFHIFDLMNYFAGHPTWAFAHVLQNGREARKSDAHAGSEPNGLVAGDCLMAMYGFPEGVYGTFESRRDLKGGSDRFSLEIHGSEGMIALRSLSDVVWFQGPIFNPAKPHRWQAISTPEWDAVSDKMHWCNQQLVHDLLKSVEEDREPIASLEDGIWALEMILSVYASHMAKARVALPLKNRRHPLK